MIIDDDVDFTRRTAFVLTHDGMEVKSINRTEDILRDMRMFAPDALLLDVMMPGVSGFDICRMLRTIPRWRDLPITFTTAYSDVDTRIACLKSGGDDYLIKPIVNEELMTRLRMQLERARLLKQRLEHDNVSGLLLREPFMQQLSTMISEARRHGWNVSLAFGRVVVPNNDDPMVSDTVLTILGNVLHRRLRPEDLKGMWGSDKVILAFRNEEAPEVLTMLRRAADDLHSMPISAGANATPLEAAFHFGVAQFPYDGATIHELLETAEQRLTGKERPSADKRVSA
jgi:diguanylate cyclase (GGDEF)-like protein